MSLSSQLKPAFGSGDRSRGETYFEMGEVISFSVLGGLLKAEVGGSYGSYEVTIDVEVPTNLEALYCECPRFHGGHNCKHIWAAVLAYDEVMEQKAARTNKPRSARAKKVRTDQPAPPAKKAKRKNAARKSAVAPSWQSLLSTSGNGDMDGSATEDSDNNGRELAPVEPLEEIYYVIDAAANPLSQQETLDLVVLQRVRKSNGEWSRLNRLRGFHVSEHPFQDPDDARIVHALSTSVPHYSRNYEFPAEDSADFQIIVQESRELLDVLLSSDRFYWSDDVDFEHESLRPIRDYDLSAPYFICMEVVDVPKQGKTKAGAAELRFFIEQQIAPGIEDKPDSQGKRVADDDIIKLANDGSCLLQSSLIDIENAYAIPLWRNAQQYPPIQIAKSERVEFLQQLAATPGTPSVRLPDSWSVTPRQGNPKGNCD